MEVKELVMQNVQELVHNVADLARIVFLLKKIGGHFAEVLA
jgi:hypothetical protein